MPNLPYRFANSDITFYWPDLLRKGNKLTVTYDNLYMHRFPLYSEAVGNESKFIVPTQFSHNLTISYGVQEGHYNYSFECRNLRMKSCMTILVCRRPAGHFTAR